ncbi:PAS domain-containing protein [Halovenus sp. HT40]|uniref:PAS domain-containing protein n=1 Tax=Halovenus sp. HT40 TaxID=3126691 RepID=UPI00300E7F32
MAQAEGSSGTDSERLTVLCVATQPGMAELTGACLERSDSRISTVTALTVAEAFERLREGEIDCIVSEYHLSDADGLVLLEAIRASHPALPFVLFTSRGSEGVASRAITAGVTDYVEQTTGVEQYDRLASRITTAVDQYRRDRQMADPEQQATATLEPAVDPVFITVDGSCVYANAAARSLLGEEPADRPLASVLDIDDSTVAAVEAGESRLTALRLDAGSTSVRVTARAIEWDDHSGAVYVCSPEGGRDLTTAESRSDVLETAFRSAPDGILLVGPDGSVLTYNDRFPSLWGIDPATLDAATVDFIGMLLSDSIDGTDTPASRLSDLWAVTEPRRDEISLADGGMLEQYIVPLQTAEGDRLGTALYYRDLSETVRAANAREPVFDRMSDAVCALDDDWQFTYVNDRATDLTGRDRSDLLGKRLWDAFPGLVGTDLEDQYREAIATGTTLTTETYYEPLAKHLEIRLFPSETGMTIYLRDISHERDIEAELRRTIEELETLYELASDQDRPFEKKRRQMLRIGAEYFDLPYGFVTKVEDGEQLIVDSIGDHHLLQPGETCALDQSYCRKTITSETDLLAVQNAIIEGWEDDPAYETFDLGTYVGAKLLVNGELYGTLCFASTEPREREFSDSERTLVEVMAKWLSYEYDQRAYRQQLEEQNDRLERFASMVSHDLRNPLNVAMTRLDLAAEESDSEHLGSVADAHDRMQALIEDILLLARQDGAVENQTDLNLGAVAKAAWETVETGPASLSVDGDRVVSAEESWLVQLFENLFRNAVEHGPADSGADDPGLSITVGTIEDGFYVEDDGTGIPAEDRDRIFEEGFSGSPTGNGLGLTIVSEIVDAHGWTTTVTESETGGARFEISGVE